MLRFSFFLFACFSALHSWAQFSIFGKLTDQNSNTLPAITIKISGSGAQVNYTQTDSLGNYHFKGLKGDKYLITYAALNFKTTTRSLNLTADTIINIQLFANAQILADVEIKAKQPLITQKIDRTIFDAENSLAAIGTDALELLAKVPGVRVLNDKVSLVGKGSVSVMIDDKLVQLAGDDLSNYLKSISAGNIAKIEIITNPPAKYDAQGNNGLINIVTKKALGNGFRGSVNAGLNQATYATAVAGGNLNYRKDKLTLYINLNFRKGSLVPLEQSNIYYPAKQWEVVNKDRNFRTVPSGQLGFDYQFSKRGTVGASYAGGLTNFHSEEQINTSVFGAAHLIDSALNSNANAKIRSHYHSASIYLKQLLDTAGKTFTLNADWFRYNDDKNRFFDNTSYFSNGQLIPGSFAEYLSASKQQIALYTLKADFDLPYPFLKISLGGKTSFIQNESDVNFFKRNAGIYIPDEKQSNLFSYRENTQALYLNASKNIKRWDFQFGLRGEYTQLDGVSVNEHNQIRYFQLFPTAFINYRASGQSVWSVNYGRRINRPAYRKLNPFRWYSNQYVYTEGNPFLKPSYNNNISLMHIYKQLFTTTFSFSKTADGYNDVNFVDALSNTQSSKPVNFITGYHYQLSNSVVLNPLKIWENTSQLDVFYNVANSALPQTLKRLTGLGAYFASTNQFIFNQSKTVLGDLSFWYAWPTVDGVNQSRSQYNLDIGFKTLWLDKKLQIALAATDILKTDRYRFSSLINGINQVYHNYYDSRQLRFSVRYNFGNEKIKRQEIKQGNEEERKRSN